MAGILMLGAPTMAHAQDLSLGLTAGIGSIGLPGPETGVAGTGGEEAFAGAGLGPHLGFSGALTLGRAGNFDMSLGFSGFGTMVQRGFSRTETLTGPGFVTITGLSTPGNSSIALTTNSGGGTASGNATVSNSDPEGGGSTTIVNLAGAGAQDSVAVTPAGTGASFTYGGVVTDGPDNSASAYGAVGASDGGLFIAAGDLTGLAITTEASHDIFYGGADLSLAVGGMVNQAMSVQAYAGPSYRLLAQHGETTITADIAEATAGAALARYSIENEFDLDTHYLGGVVGLNASYALNDHLILSLGGEGGVYHAVDSLRGTERYIASEADGTAIATASNSFSAESSGLAWSARGSGLLTLLLAPNRQLSFGGTVDYLSRVASIERGEPTVTSTGYAGGSDDGSADYTAGGAGTVPILTFGDMWTFTGTVSLTGQF